MGGLYLRAHAIDFFGASLQEADLKMTLKNEVYLVVLALFATPGTRVLRAGGFIAVRGLPGSFTGW